jgi:hypothetical protein
MGRGAAAEVRELPEDQARLEVLAHDRELLRPIERHWRVGGGGVRALGGRSRSAVDRYGDLWCG